MSATTHDPFVLDVSGTPGIPFSRLTAVEIRKCLDTRAGRWLLYVTGFFIVAAMAIMMIIGYTQDEELTLGVLFQVVNVPLGLFVPIIGILAVTGEFGQRTGMVTFTLEPHRLRIVAAKLVTGVVLGVATVIVAIGVGALTLAIFGATGGEATWDADAGLVLGFVLVQVIGVLTGFAFGMLFLNTPVAIVAFFAYSFVLPGIIAAAAAVWTWASDLRPWIDFGAAQTPLFEGHFGDVHWGQFLVTGLLWFVLPVVLGCWRLLRAEVK